MKIIGLAVSAILWALAGAMPASAVEGYCEFEDKQCQTFHIQVLENNPHHDLLQAVLQGTKNLYEIGDGLIRDIDFKGTGAKPISLDGGCHVFYFSRWKVTSGSLKPVIWDNLGSRTKREGRAAVPLAQSDWPPFLEASFGERGFPDEVYKMRTCGMNVSIAFAEDSFSRSMDVRDGSWVQACIPDRGVKLAFPGHDANGYPKAIWGTPGTIPGMLARGEFTALHFVLQ